MNNEINRWQECISYLPDNKFFDIMRLYLGDIQTPYNKQRLVSSLASFIKKQENLDNLINYIDEFDAKIISAIAIIPAPTEKVIAQFFSTEYTMVEIYSAISNLKERLIVYEDNKILRLNPLIRENLEPFVNIKNILKEEQLASHSMEDEFSISPDFLLAFISFINIRGCSSKNDGSIKKNDLKHIEEVFHNRSSCIQKLLCAFINLRLVKEGEKSYEVDAERFKLFAQLPEKNQYALLCAAAGSYLGRDSLKAQAQLFLDVTASIPQSGYTRASIIKLAFLTGSSSENSVGGASRFSKILEAARQEAAGNSITGNEENKVSIIDRLLDSAIEFGLIQCVGQNEAEENIYVKGPVYRDEVFYAPEGTDLKVLNIDSTFTVTLMPGLRLQQSLPFSELMVIKNYSVAPEFEISRHSLSVAFDKGWDIQKITETLEKFSNYGIPQNLRISIADWHNSYSSARLYLGYVLKVTDSNINFAENNPNIKRYIKEKLGEGIYLLNIPVDHDVNDFIAGSGLEFMGRIRNSQAEAEKLPFPVLHAARGITVEEKDDYKINFAAAGDQIKLLMKTVAEMNLEINQKESISHKIHQRLILSPDHLRHTSIRSEIIEADGMDYSGKLHLLEAALKESDMVELTIPEFNSNDKFWKLLGKVKFLSKETGDSIVVFESYPQQDTHHFVLSRITHVRRLRY